MNAITIRQLNYLSSKLPQPMTRAGSSLTPMAEKSYTPTAQIKQTLRVEKGVLRPREVIEDISRGTIEREAVEALQGTVGARPTATTHAALNNQAVLSFDGGDYLQIGDMTGGDLTTFEVWTACVPDDASTPRALFDNSGAAGGRAAIYQGATQKAQLYAEVGGDIGSVNNAFVSDAGHIVRGFFQDDGVGNSAGLVIKHGAADVTWSGALNTPGLRGFTMGAFFNGGFGWLGWIAEEFVINRAATANEVTDVRNYMQPRYGITPL